MDLEQTNDDISKLMMQNDLAEQKERDANRAEAEQEKAAEEAENDPDVSEIDAGNVLLSVDMPHEADTEDIAFDVGPEAYDYHHSKMWNHEVDNKAMEFENEIKIQENLKKSKEKAKQDAQRKAAVAKANAKKQQLVQAAQKIHDAKYKNPSIDLSELYSGMVPDRKNLQLADDDIWAPYEHHS